MSTATYVPCQVDGCARPHPDDRVMCDRCWRLVDTNLREAVATAAVSLAWAPDALKAVYRTIKSARTDAGRMLWMTEGLGMSEVKAREELRYVARCTALAMGEM